MENNIQLNFFTEYKELDKKIKIRSTKECNSDLAVYDIIKLDNYNLEQYERDIRKFGLEDTWRNINKYALLLKNNNKFLDVSNFAELYEIGLAIENKYLKKKSGQYYTPDDVAKVMATWLAKIKGENICDVACGTGKLILTYLDLIGYNSAKKMITEGKLFLYDSDKIALNICKTILLVKYGIENEQYIHVIHGDFLDSEIKLPENCRVISNPPYASVKEIASNWKNTSVSMKTKELYAMFMEKIITQSLSSVIITPYSFIGSNKFYQLRLLMNRYSGFIISFDNVPGNIFCGRKHGIFNTNTANSVRAAITVVNNEGNNKGFRLTPLLRFKTEERKKLLNSHILEEFVADKFQIINNNNSYSYEKCFKELQNLLEEWKKNSDSKLQDILTNNKTKYTIYMPNTCRYFTTGAKRKLNRVGFIELHFKNEDYFNIAYCMINSSFAYWWWRIYDGGITYPLSLLKSIPIKIKEIDQEKYQILRKIVQEMILVEEKYIVKKLNAGVEQENIKFPDIYRDRLNKIILDIYGCIGYEEKLKIVHKNNIFE